MTQTYSVCPVPRTLLITRLANVLDIYAVRSVIIRFRPPRNFLFSAKMMFPLLIALIVPLCLGRMSEKRDYKDHPCIRECQKGVTMTCEYNFTLEYYFTLTKACYKCPFNITDCDRPHCIAADGTPRGLLVVNRLLPGPAIHICEGDTVVVNVYNHLEGSEGTSIHWHGIFQKGSQHMDGVAMLTQCPIPAWSSFQYKFKANNPGTHFWHAHSGLQRADGVFGAFVVRQPIETEAHAGLYESDLPEHTMIVNDWLVELAVNRFAHHHHAGGDNKPKSMLINGRGVLHNFSDPDTGEQVHTPYSVFTVQPGMRYRFRVISNGIMNCPIQVSIDGHFLWMIASDGNPFEPIEVESFNIFAGERFDFMLNATQTVGNYWIRVRGIADCSVKFAMQSAVLRYAGAADELPTGTPDFEGARRPGKLMNPWNKKGTEELIQMSVLNSMLEDPDVLYKPEADKKFYLGMDFYVIDNYHFHDPTYYPISAIEKPMHLYSPQVNRISGILPPSPPLSQLQDIPEEIFCNADNVKKNCSAEFCECVHLLKVDIGDVVELILVDEGKPFDANHPMHLHGHAFRVVGMDRLNSSTTLDHVKMLDAEGKLPRKLNRSVAKDTITVPDGGYSIIRFLADNPGFWFFHCHIEFHVEIGMNVVIQAGRPDQMPKIPKNFPKCGHWQFDGYEDGKTKTCGGGRDPPPNKTKKQKQKH